MIDCQGQQHQSLDALLNETYKVLRKGITDDKAYAESLKREQIAWIKLRDEAQRSTFERAGGGSLSTVESNSVALEQINFEIVPISKLTFCQKTLFSAESTPLRGGCRSYVSRAFSK